MKTFRVRVEFVVDIEALDEQSLCEIISDDSPGELSDSPFGALSLDYKILEVRK